MAPKRPAAVRRFLPKLLFAASMIFYLFTFGIFSRRHRYLIFQIAEHFGLKTSIADDQIPLLPIGEILDPHLDLMLLEPLGTAGNVTLLEELVISCLARRANPPIAFEIGTFDGRTSLNIAANLPENGRVFTLDLPQAELTKTRFALARDEIAFVQKETSGARSIGTKYGQRIEQLYGDSAVFDFSPYETKCGMVFVDGSHAYDYVMHDSQTALKLAATPGSVILWHDYQRDWPDVIGALNELHTKRDTFAGLHKIEGTSLVILRR